MSAHRTLRRTVATLATATAAVLAALVPAATAQAADDDVQVSFSNFPSSVTAGQTRGFTVRFQNHSHDKQPIDTPRAMIVVHLDGLQPDAVHVTLRGAELPKSTNGADVVFTDLQPMTLQLRDNRSVSRGYSIKFDEGTPSGRAQLTATALDSANNQRGSTSDSFQLKSSAGPASPSPRPSHTPSPSASPPPAVNVPLPSGTVSLAPLDDRDATQLAGDSSGGAPVFVYILGGILMLIGATILWMLFRKPRAAEGAAVAGDPDPMGPPTLGYPAGGPRASAPTAMLPVVTDQRTATVQQVRPGPMGPRPNGPPGPMGNAGPGLWRDGGPRRDPRSTAENPRVPNRPTPPGVDPWTSTTDIDAGGPGR